MQSKCRLSSSLLNRRHFADLTRPPTEVLLRWDPTAERPFCCLKGKTVKHDPDLAAAARSYFAECEPAPAPAPPVSRGIWAELLSAAIGTALGLAAVALLAAIQFRADLVALVAGAL